ncbi:hypothetical protein KDW97_26690, partial [Burkholderia cenocepacia]
NIDLAQLRHDLFGFVLLLGHSNVLLRLNSLLQGGPLFRGQTNTPLRVAQRLHDRAPDFDTCPRRLVRGLIFGIEVISPGRFDSVFANPHVRRPRAAGCRLHGLDDDFVTVEYIAMAFDSFVHTVPLTCA